MSQDSRPASERQLNVLPVRDGRRMEGHMVRTPSLVLVPENPKARSAEELDALIRTETGSELFII